jgi:hypothetical protein
MINLAAAAVLVRELSEQQYAETPRSARRPQAPPGLSRPAAQERSRDLVDRPRTRLEVAFRERAL